MWLCHKWRRGGCLFATPLLSLTAIYDRVLNNVDCDCASVFFAQLLNIAYLRVLCLEGPCWRGRWLVRPWTVSTVAYGHVFANPVWCYIPEWYGEQNYMFIITSKIYSPVTSNYICVPTTRNHAVWIHSSLQTYFNNKAFKNLKVSLHLINIWNPHFTNVPGNRPGMWQFYLFPCIC